MAKVLTVKAVDAAKPADKRVEIPDGGLPGLYLVVQPSGAKSWAVRYRYGGKPKKMGLGRYPVVGLGEAREKAGEALKVLDGGTDPAQAKKAERAAAEEQDRDTIENVVDLFITRYAKPKNRSWEETDRILRREVLPKWQGRAVGDIRKRDIIELIDGIVDRGAATMANRVFAAVRKMFSWAAERDLIEASPCAGLRPPAPETRRDRVLTEDELVAVWRGADAMGWPFGPMVKLLILTGQRREEVAQARWSEMDLDGAEWVIPAARAKNNKAHLVPLSDPAVEIIKALPKIAPGGKAGGRPVWLFTTTGETPVSGFARAKKRLDKLTLEALSKDAEEPVEMAPWRLHDIRRTVATGMAGLNVNLPVVERILNHISGSFGGVAGVYQHHQFNDDKRAALDAWASHVLHLVQGAGGDNVVRLRGQG